MLHPVAVLAAMLAYKAGRGADGQHPWSPAPEVVDALEDAFQLAFANVPATGKRHYVAVDVSGSMGSGEVGGVTGLTPRMAAAAIAMTFVRAEPHCHLAAFADSMAPLEVAKSDSLADVCRKAETLLSGATDCALPMLDALERKIAVDVFVVLTDSETRFGGIHPAEALRRYRETMRLPAKLVVVGLASGGFRIADPDDAGMLDVAGFDTAVPELIADFVAN
ncbi:MAG: hypothetical protein GY953_17310 [bacterium]|nr:hypothetical protein [bacterium]